MNMRPDRPRIIGVWTLLVIAACHSGWGQDLSMRQIMADANGAPLVAIAGNVFSSPTPIGINVDSTTLMPAGDQRLALLTRFLACQRLLEAGKLTEAVAFYAPGQAQERIKAKFEKNPDQQIAQRKSISLEIRGCGVSGEFGAVWYDLVGASLPGGRFSWVDQFRRIGDEWMLDPTIPLNTPTMTALASVAEASLRNEPVVPLSPEKYAFVALSSDGSAMPLKNEDLTSIKAVPEKVIVALSRQLVRQKPTKISAIDPAMGQAATVLAEAYRLSTSGEDAAKLFLVPQGKPLKEVPFNWGKKEKSMDYLYACLGSSKLALAVIGTATEPRQTVLLSNEDEKGFKIALTSPFPRWGATFGLIGSQPLLGQALKALDGFVE